MALPLHEPFSPIKAPSIDPVPIGKEWQQELKSDGFHALCFATQAK